MIVKRVVNQTSKGRMFSMYSLVVVGNGNGLASYGEGKHEEAANSVRKATNQAIKNLQYFHRYNDRTLYHDIEYKFHSTRLKLMVRPPGIFCLSIYSSIYLSINSSIYIYIYFRIWSENKSLYT